MSELIEKINTNIESIALEIVMLDAQDIQHHYFEGY